MEGPLVTDQQVPTGHIPSQASPPDGPRPTLGPQSFCFACGSQIDARAEVCPNCGVRQPGAAGAVSRSTGKDRLAAAAFALVVGGFGVHKFYLGQVGLGVVYLLLSWTGIPSLIAWIEGILYLRTSETKWVAEYGGTVRQRSGAAIGCLWLLAILPLIAIVFSIVALIFLGGQVRSILNT